jgi:hypothetical protein
MTDEEINIAIAEFRGYKNIRTEIVCEDSCPTVMTLGDNDCGCRVQITDYCNNKHLNAMRDVEMTIKDVAIQRDYVAVLGEICKSSGRFASITASARQRAEAFVKTVIQGGCDGQRYPY